MPLEMAGRAEKSRRMHDRRAASDENALEFGSAGWHGYPLPNLSTPITNQPTMPTGWHKRCNKNLCSRKFRRGGSSKRSNGEYWEYRFCQGAIGRRKMGNRGKNKDRFRIYGHNSRLIATSHVPLERRHYCRLLQRAS